MRRLVVTVFTYLMLVAPLGFAEEAGAYLPIPKNIETRNVPAIPAAQAARLDRYNHARFASLYGWEDNDTLLIGTRFSNVTQLHRVAEPMGYREQITYLKEPLAAVAIPPAGTGDELIISWDVGGSEFDQLFRFNPKTGASRMVSDGKSLYAYALWSPDGSRFAYVTTERDGKSWDTHVQHLDGHVDRAFESEGGYWYPLGWSPDGTKILLKNRVSVNVSSVHELDLTTRRVKPLVGSGIDGAPEAVSVEHASYDDRGGLFFVSDENAEFLRLQRMDLETGEVTLLTEDVEWDVEGFTLSPDFKRLAYVVNEGGASQLQVLNLPSLKPVKVPELPPGVVREARFSPDSKRLAIELNTAVAPSDVFTIDLRRRTLTRWTASEIGGLDRSRFVQPTLIEYESFDGRDIPAFVFTPEGEGPHPVVIYIHGGPEAQYRPFFSTLIQSYVSEMNVAVIAPNVRGSKGYGKTYLTLDNGKLREDSVKDIGALLDWVDGRTEFKSDKIAVMGGSYGGYMVLASMVHYGDRLAAAVESVGISNFVTFLENTQPYRQDIRRVEYGDERDPEMRAHLESISPLNHVDKMRTPVLISQGANDPRVPASESEQIYQALTEKGIPAWYVLAHDEGHGMRKKVNRDYDRAAKFLFLEAYLNSE